MKDVHHAGIAAAAAILSFHPVVDDGLFSIHEVLVALDPSLVRQVEDGLGGQLFGFPRVQLRQQLIHLGVDGFQGLWGHDMTHHQDPLASQNPGCPQESAFAAAQGGELHAQPFHGCLAFCAAQQSRQVRAAG